MCPRSTITRATAADNIAHVVFNGSVIYEWPCPVYRLLEDPITDKAIFATPF